MQTMNGTPGTSTPASIRLAAAPEAAPSTTIAGDHLVVDVQGTTRTFLRGTIVSIGRDANNEIVLSNPTVSRRHARIAHDGATWRVEDVGSASGVLVDGLRVTKPVALGGTTVITIGSRDAGERLVTVTTGTTKSAPIRRIRTAARSKTAAIATIVALAATGLGVGAVALTRGGDNTAAAASDADALARATVFLKAGTATGSGSIVDASKGLILTNAHVVAPAAPGTGVREQKVESKLGANPTEVSISIAPRLDAAAEPRFVGQVVAADGYTDLAIVKITKTAGGRLIDADDLKDLTEIALGDSDKVRSGETVRVLGYPTVAASRAATLTTGVVAGTVGDDRLSSNRALLNVDASIAPGNSGGIAVDAKGHLVGVPSMVARDTSSTTIVAQIGRLRPVNLAKPLVDAARKGETYTNPAVPQLKGTEAIDKVRVVRAGSSAGIESACTAAGATVTKGATAIGISFDFAGFPQGAGLDAAVVVTNADGAAIGSFFSTAAVAFTPADHGCATVTVATNTLPAGTYKATVHLGANLRAAGAVELTVA